MADPESMKDELELLRAVPSPEEFEARLESALLDEAPSSSVVPLRARRGTKLVLLSLAALCAAGAAAAAYSNRAPKTALLESVQPSASVASAPVVTGPDPVDSPEPPPRPSASARVDPPEPPRLPAAAPTASSSPTRDGSKEAPAPESLRVDLVRPRLDGGGSGDSPDELPEGASSDLEPLPAQHESPGRLEHPGQRSGPGARRPGKRRPAPGTSRTRRRGR